MFHESWSAMSGRGRSNGFVDGAPSAVGGESRAGRYGGQGWGNANCGEDGPHTGGEGCRSLGYGGGSSISKWGSRATSVSIAERLLRASNGGVASVDVNGLPARPGGLPTHD